VKTLQSTAVCAVGKLEDILRKEMKLLPQMQKKRSEPNPVWEASLNKTGDNSVEREVRKLFRTHAIEDIRLQEANTRYHGKIMK